MTYQLRAGEIHYAAPICVVDRSGAPLQALTTLLVGIRSSVPTTAGQYWDFGGAIPQFRSSGWTTRLATLTEVSASLSPGYYRHVAGWTTAGLAAGLYIFEFTDSGATSGNMPQTDDAQVVVVPLTGTASAGGTSTITLAGGSSADNLYQFSDLEITGGTGAGQTRSILVYNGTTKVAYVHRPWNVTPDTTSTFAVRARTQPIIIDAALAQAGASNSITLASSSSSVTDWYVGSEVVIAAGTGLGGQPRIITAYNGTTKVATIVSPWATVPDNTSVYVLLPVGRTIIVSNLDKTGYALTAGQEGAIATTLLDTFLSGHTTAGTVGKSISLVDVAASSLAVPGSAMTLTSGERAAVAASTLGTAVPGAFAAGSIGFVVGTNLDINLGSRLATSGYTTPPTAAANASALLGTTVPGAFGAGTVGFNLDVATGTRLATSGYAVPPSTAANASAVWTQALPGLFASGSAGFIVGTNLDALTSSRLAASGYTAPPTSAANATAVWNQALPGAFAGGSAGAIVGTNLDINVGSRLATAGYTAPPSAATNANAVWQTVVPGAFSAGQAGFVLGTNLDILVSSRLPTSSYAAPPGATVVAAAVWDALTVTAATVNSFGALVKIQLDANVSSRLPTSGYTTPPTAAAIATQVWQTSLPGAFAAGQAGANLDINVGSRLATSGYTAAPTAAANASAVWQTAVPGTFASGQAGLVLGTNLDAMVSSRLAASGYVAPPSAVVVAAAVWDELTVASATANSFGALVKLQLDATVTSRMATFTYTTPPTVNSISTQVRADIITDHGSGGYATATGFSTLTASQVWATVVPGAFAAGSSGYVLGNLPTADANANALLDKALLGHTAAGTSGKALSLIDVASSSLATGDALATAKTAIDLVNATITAIQGVSWAGTTDSLRALRAALDAAQADLALVKGTGFVSGTDDLHSAHALLASAATGAALTSAVSPLATSAQVTTAQNNVIAEVDAKAVEIEGAGFSSVASLVAIKSAIAATATSSQLGSAASAIITAVNDHTDTKVASIPDAIEVKLAVTHGAGQWDAVGGGGSSFDLDQLMSAHTTPGTLGAFLAARLDAAMTTRALPSDITAAVAPLATLVAVAAGTGAINTHTDAGVAAIAAAGTANTTAINANTNAALAGLGGATAALQASLDNIAGASFGVGDDLHAIKRAIINLPVPPTPGAIATAFLTAAASGPPGSVGWSIKLTRQWSTYVPGTYMNRKMVIGQNFVITDDDGIQVLAIVPLVDINDGPIAPGVGEPGKFG